MEKQKAHGDKENETEKKNTNEVVNEEIDGNILVNEVGGIGGATTNEILEGVKEENKNSKNEKSGDENKSQYELDVEYLKANYDFIMPVTGTVTSRYGKREETEVVSANHQGIDVGANEGTPIYAAIDGTVTVPSSEGEYGKHIDITNGDVLTRYAHCSKLLVKEGEKVTRGTNYRYGW